jgi:hypothetical protein
MKSEYIGIIVKYRLLIIEFSIFTALAFVVVYLFSLKNESLLFIVLIFSIYLIVSGRISQFKFMNLEIMMKDAENKQPEVAEVSRVPPELDTMDIAKGDPNRLNNEIKPILIREAKKIKVLRITHEYKHAYQYNTLYEYLKYFTHVIFIEGSNKFSGFAIREELLEWLNKPEKQQKFINEIQEWKLNLPVRKNSYIIKGASRRQVFDRMKELDLTVLPVISLDRNYEGVIDRDSLIWQITRDLYDYAKFPPGSTGL